MTALKQDPPSYTIPPALTKRAQQKRALILAAAMRYFAEHGYEAARVGDIAADLGIAKGSVFQHFGSKDGLFLEAYKDAVQTLPGYLDVPAAIKEEGFFAVVRYRLHHADRLREQHDVQYKVMLLGNYGSDMNIKKRISRFLRHEDPLELKALVRMGIERSEIRKDVDAELVASFLESTLERFQDSLLMAEHDPDLFHPHRDGNSKSREDHIEEFVRVLQGAIGSPQAAKTS